MTSARVVLSLGRAVAKKIAIFIVVYAPKGQRCL